MFGHLCGLSSDLQKLQTKLESLHVHLQNIDPFYRNQYIKYINILIVDIHSHIKCFKYYDIHLLNKEVLSESLEDLLSKVLKNSDANNHQKIEEYLLSEFSFQIKSINYYYKCLLPYVDAHHKSSFIDLFQTAHDCNNTVIKQLDKTFDEDDIKHIKNILSDLKSLTRCEIRDRLYWPLLELVKKYLNNILNKAKNLPIDIQCNTSSGTNLLELVEDLQKESIKCAICMKIIVQHIEEVSKEDFISHFLEDATTTTIDEIESTAQLG